MKKSGKTINIKNSPLLTEETKNRYEKDLKKFQKEVELDEKKQANALAEIKKINPELVFYF